MRVLPCGDRALLVELDDAGQRRALDAALRQTPPLDVTEHVPGAHTVLVLARPGTDLAALARDLTTLAASLAVAPATLLEAPVGGAAAANRAATALLPAPVVIQVRYDGPDLDLVAELAGLSAAEVTSWHTGQVWTVEFAGFAPGFGYLVGDGRRLDVPRRHSPRTRIPAGAVALAGGYCGVYPRPTPGGWQLIGSTDAPLWDETRTPPALLAPGTRVRFAAVT